MQTGWGIEDTVKLGKRPTRSSCCTDCRTLLFGTETVEAYVDKNTNGRVGKVKLVHIGGWFLLGEPA